MGNVIFLSQASHHTPSMFALPWWYPSDPHHPWVIPNVACMNRITAAWISDYGEIIIDNHDESAFFIWISWKIKRANKKNQQLARQLALSLLHGMSFFSSNYCWLARASMQRPPFLALGYYCLNVHWLQRVALQGRPGGIARGGAQARDIRKRGRKQGDTFHHLLH